MEKKEIRTNNNAKRKTLLFEFYHSYRCKMKAIYNEMKDLYITKERHLIEAHKGTSSNNEKGFR